MEKLTVGMLDCNCYLIPGDLDPNVVLVVDPGGDAEAVLSALGDRTAAAVLLTHGHADHTGALNAFNGTEIYIGRKDAEMLSDPEKSVGVYLGDDSPRIPATRFFDGGEEVSFPGFSSPVRVIATPGHTPGGMCYVILDELYSGDTLFRHSWGRTDFPGGSAAELDRSIRSLLALPGNMKVHPGHDLDTDLKSERAFFAMGCGPLMM
ncbi:MAG: MBL fold metallo-hydrolase [Clostridia bacterium]|nr:MBL fold metallo-hydrolase [Clostridia bacterium]